MKHAHRPNLAARLGLGGLGASLLIGAGACQDFDAATFARPMVQEEPSGLELDSESVVTVQGAVAEAHTQSFHLDVSSPAEGLDDVLVVLDAITPVPPAGRRVTVRGRFDRVAGQPFASPLDVDYQVWDDTFGQNATLVASSVEERR